MKIFKGRFLVWNVLAEHKKKWFQLKQNSFCSTEPGIDFKTSCTSQGRNLFWLYLLVWNRSRARCSSPWLLPTWAGSWALSAGKVQKSLNKSRFYSSQQTAWEKVMSVAMSQRSGREKCVIPERRFIQINTQAHHERRLQEDGWILFLEVCLHRSQIAVFLSRPSHFAPRWRGCEAGADQS